MAKRTRSDDRDGGSNLEQDGETANVPLHPAPDANNTPTSRILPQSMSEAAKRRIDEEVPTGRCLIENVSPFRGVDYVHCFARKNHRSKKV